MSDRTSIPAELSSILSRLRGRIRRYVLLEGSALLLAVLGGLFWLSLALDHAWFQISRLELPRWFRLTFVVAVVAMFAFLLMSWVVVRALRGMRSRSLALVLERRFPELNDRLVTAVEFAEKHTALDSDLSAAMLRRTISEAVEATRVIELASVFDRRPLQRAITLAVVAVASIGGLAVASQSTLETWKNSFLNLNDQYWNRRNALVVRVIAQPGDIVREFAADQSIKHPRGADLTLLIEAADGTVPPERVQLRYRLANGRGQGTVLCSRIGERQFRHSIDGLLDDVEFRVYGGDFVNREPYRVDIVEAPALDQIDLACFYPAYTGLAHPESTVDAPRRDIVPVQGTQVELPAETEFILQSQSNKPLARVRMQFGEHELVFAQPKEWTAPGANENGGDSEEAAPFVASSGVVARLIERSEEGAVLSDEVIPDAVASQWLDRTGRQLRVPFVLSAYQSEAAVARIDALQTEIGPPFVLAPDTNLRIYLEDADGIMTAEPARVLLAGVADATPMVETRLRGIGTSITRKASIPVPGRVTDDYGLAAVRFEYQINDAEKWEPRALQSALPVSADGSAVREFELTRSEAEPYERFNVVPLDLTIGQKLTISVVAEDADNLNGPHITRGERYSFKVVSNEELQSLLYQRELNLRAQFDRIITETRQTQQDLIRHRALVDERRRLQSELDAASKAPAAPATTDANAADGDTASGTDEESAALTSAEIQEKQSRIREINQAVTACAERSLHAVRKNANETASVELAFRDIREELVNNALHTPQTLERIDDRIVNPLNSINTQDYPDVDGAIGVFRLTNERGQNPTQSIDHSSDLLSGMIARMEQILNEMEQLKEFQKVIEELKQIIEDQEALLEKTQKERKRALLLESLQ